MNDASTEFNQLNNLKEELENILNLNLTDLSHYLGEVTEVKKLLLSNKEVHSHLLLKTSNIENSIKTVFERVNKIEEDIKLLSAKDSILFNSIGDINSEVKYLSLESSSQKRDLKILYDDLLKTDERLNTESAHLNEKNVLLEKKVEKMKVWIILLFGSILAFVIVPTIFHLIASLWS
jgi:chromosome segregation ATPase